MSGNTSQATVVEKEKNPKRVAAGKKLAERNRKYKEHFEKTGGGGSETPKTGNVALESVSSNNLNYYVIGAIVLGAAGLMYYQSTQTKPVTKSQLQPRPTPAEKPKPISKPSRLIKV